MFRIDLHVHTRRYSQCAEGLDPALLPAVMRARGISGVVLSEHDAMWSRAELAELAGLLGPDQRVYRGVEVTTTDGHLVVIGLGGTDGLARGMPGSRLVERALREGAAVILAHPDRGRTGPYHQVLSGVHAVEVCSTSTLGRRAECAAELATSLGLRAVAGSDAHAPDQVGGAFTLFPRLPEDEAALAGMIRAGEGRPWRCEAGPRSCRCSPT